MDRLDLATVSKVGYYVLLGGLLGRSTSLSDIDLQGSLFFVIKGETSLEKTQLLADFIKN